MHLTRIRFPRGLSWVLGLVCLASCSRGALVPEAVPETCNLPLPHRCDICSTGEMVCAHYVVRDGVCVAETCPPAPSLPDASAPPADALTDSSGVTLLGVPFDCGPAGAGLRCSCGLEMYFPAPIIDGGQQTSALPPDSATVVAYGTIAEFDALAVGRWQRTAGMSELICEQFGVEFTADHRLIPLMIASDGSVQAATVHGTSYSVTFINGSPMWLEVPGLSTNPPIFFDSGRSMYFNFAPWPASYVRAP